MKRGKNYILIRDHSFSTFENFRKNEYFLPPDMHMCVCVSWNKKC